MKFENSNFVFISKKKKKKKKKIQFFLILATEHHFMLVLKTKNKHETWNASDKLLSNISWKLFVNIIQ